MRIVSTLVLSLTVILNAIEFSWQFECLPNGEPIPGVPRSRTSDLPDIFQSPERSLSLARPHTPDSPARYSPAELRSTVRARPRSPPARPHISVRSLPPAERSIRARSRYPPARSRSPPARPHSPGSRVSSSPAEPRSPLRARSRSLRASSKSPPARRRSLNFLEYGPEQLRSIRLIPNANPNRRFEIRKYTFPPDKPLQLKGRHDVPLSMPTEEQTVLSTSSGDVLAIFENNNKLRGIYAKIFQNHSRYRNTHRVKINIESGAIEDMTPEEVKESLLGDHRRITTNFKTLILSDLPLQDNFNL